MLPIVERGAEQAKPEVDASALASALQTKKEDKKPAPKAMASAPRRDEPLVDLHASEILETTAGMSSADIHDYQRDYFHRTMQEHIRERGRKNRLHPWGRGDGRPPEPLSSVSYDASTPRAASRMRPSRSTATALRK